MASQNYFMRFWRTWLWPDRYLLLFGLIMLIIVWSAAGWQIERDRQTNIEIVRHDGDKFARAFEEHVRRLLNANDQYLSFLKTAYEESGAVTPHVHNLFRQIATDPLVIQMALVDANGRFMASFLSYTPDINVSDRPYFKAHRTDSTDRLFIDQPFIGRLSHKTIIPLSRRLNNADGSFAGVAFIGLDPAYFSVFYRNMNFNKYYVVRVIGLDGVIRASNTVSETGFDLTGGVIFKEIAKAKAGFYNSPGTHFGVPHLMSYRVLPDYPLLVQVGVSEDAFYPLHQRRLAYLGAAGGISLFIIIFTCRLIARARRQRQTEARLMLSEEKYSKAFRVSPDSIQLNRFPDGLFVEVNESFTRLTGYQWEDVAGKSSLDINAWVNHADRDLLLASLIEKGIVTNFEALFRRKDGSLGYGLMSATLLDIGNEKYNLSIVRDINDRKEAELSLAHANQDLTAAHEELLATEEELRRQYEEILDMNRDLATFEAEKTALLAAIPDLMLLVDADGILLDATQPASFKHLTDYAKYKGRSLADFLPDGLVAALWKSISETLARGSTEPKEHTVDNDGETYYFEIRFSKVDDKKVLALVRDLTAIRRSEEQVAFLSLHDPLTGAYNRTYFEEELLRLQTRGHKSLGIFVCDLDGLKLINDTLGHRHGDELLKRVAAILSTGVIPPNFTARIGGDEFAVVLFEPGAEQMAASEKAYLETVARYNEENPDLPLSLSLGWALDTDGAHVDRLFKEADDNMYRQKMHQSQSVRSAIVHTMMKAMEARDHITEGHADRLGELMERLARKLGLAPAAIADLRLFAKFHDIGKVGIPDSILGKAARLTPEEQAIMRRHCEIGYRIARSSPALAPIADWILKHHEHWDGRGYPLGLAGEQIPIECRILGIIDAYDAMTNDRPYRKALSSEAAIDEIERCAGSQFDPSLVAQFVEMIRTEP